MPMFEFRNAMAGASCGCGCPSRRAVSTALVCTAVASIMPRAAAAAPTDAEDERFMRIALDEAQAADFPFGACIVRDGQLIARGRNLGRTNADPTAHGEMTAIRACVATHGGAALRGSTIYTTGEPCAMCMGAILWSRMGRLVFAASVEQLATRLDQIMITGADLAGRAKFAPLAITGGVLADEAMALFPKRK
jgi:tRNA(Arg) A34 adenosine deaminase TadA